MFQGNPQDLPVPALQQVDPLELINSKDLSLFAFDQTSGHYYHSATGIYYYPQTDKYWDSFNGIFYLYDSEKKKHLPQEKPKKDEAKKQNANKEKKAAPVQAKKVLSSFFCNNQAIGQSEHTKVVSKNQRTS
jgi:hypothetical protein